MGIVAEAPLVGALLTLQLDDMAGDVVGVLPIPHNLQQLGQLLAWVFLYVAIRLHERGTLGRARRKVGARFKRKKRTANEVAQKTAS